MQKSKLSLLLALIFSSPMLMAQEKGMSIMDTIHVDQVVVTATRTPKLLKETPILTRVITSRDIERSGASRFEEILSGELAGMEFHQAGYGTTMSYQGLDARNILILVDGERIAGEVNGNIDFSRINPMSIERIEVMKGSSSVLYGSSAMGATINIITKKATKKYQGGAQVKYGFPFENNSTVEGNNIDMPNLNAAGYFATKRKRFSSVTDFQYQTIDGYRMIGSEPEERKYISIDKENSVNYIMPEDGIVRVPINANGIGVSGQRIFNVGQRFSFDLGAKLKLDVKGDYYNKQRYDLNDLLGANSNINRVGKYWGYNMDVNFQWMIAKNHELNFSFHQNVSAQNEDNAFTDTTIRKQRHQYFTPRAIYHFTHKGGRMTAGLDYDLEMLNYDQTSVGFRERKDFHSVSFYAQEEINLAKRMELTVGVRGLYAGFGTNGANNTGSALRVTPKAAFTYKLDNVTMRANWSMGYRNPTLKERYIAYYQEYMRSWIVGTPELKPETNQYTSLSAEYFSKNRKLTLSVLGYANWFKDKIDTYSTEVEMVSGKKESAYKYDNTQSTRILGVEFSGRVMVLKNWWWSLNYAYNHNKEVAPTNSAQYIFTSPHTANISTRYSLRLCSNTVMELGVIGQYIGAKDYEDRMPTVIVGGGVLSFMPAIYYGIYEGHQDGYMLLNANASVSYRERYKISFYANNVLNYKAKVASFNSALTPGFNSSIAVSIAF